jgi:hypothetical protein
VIRRDISFDEFVAMPALPADEKACRRSPTPERYMFDDCGHAETAARNIEASTGLPIADPFAVRSYYTCDMRRIALIVLYGATGAAAGLYSASLAIMAHRFRLSRPLLSHIAAWIVFGYFAEHVAVHARASDWHTQDIVRRLGFCFEGRTAAHFRNGDDASRWTLAVMSKPVLDLAFGPAAAWVLPAPAARPELGV